MMTIIFKFLFVVNILSAICMAIIFTEQSMIVGAFNLVAAWLMVTHIKQPLGVDDTQ